MNALFSFNQRNSLIAEKTIGQNLMLKFLPEYGSVTAKSYDEVLGTIMKSIDPEFVKFLNLLDSSPSFVIRLDNKLEQSVVSNPTIVPNNSGFYLIHGTTILRCGDRMKSIFHVNTDTGGTHLGVYWKTKKGWMDSQDELAAQVLRIKKHDIFPFDWEYSVLLEYDIYHSAS